MTSKTEQFYIRRIAELEEQIAKLLKVNAELADKVAKLSKNSSNSSTLTLPIYAVKQHAFLRTIPIILQKTA